MSHEERQLSGRLIWWIIGLALVVRLIAIPILDQDNETLFEYGKIGWNIAQGYGFSWDFDGKYPMQPTAYSPALYCYTLAPWFYIFGLNLTGPRIMHAFLLAAACWFLYKIGEWLVNRRVGLIAAVIWAIYPELIFLAVRVAIENAMFLPMLAALYLAQKTQEDWSSKKALFTGMLTGISCWVNPSLQVLGIAIPASWWLNGRKIRTGWIKTMLLFAAGAVIVISPWMIRNYIKLDAIIPLRSAFAFNMWRGNHIGATGTVRTFEGTNVDHALPVEYDAYVKAHLSPNEIERDKFYGAEVKKFIREHPDEFITLTMSRFFYIWWRDLTHPWTGNVFYMLPWIILVILAFIGSFTIWRRWREWSVWWLQILGFTVLFSLTIVVPRYRMPMYPALILLAAVGVDHLLKMYISRRALIANKK